MCGRFNQEMTWREIHDLYELLGSLPVTVLERRWNGCPSQSFAICRLSVDESRETVSLRWGLVPAWARDQRMAGRLINARSETVSHKPAFRAAFRSRRCLIPANSWFEWSRDQDGIKRPWLIAMEDSKPFSFAGIWERWMRNGESVETFSILTEAASPEIRHLHHRQPVVIAPSHFEEWLATDRMPWSSDPEEWLLTAAIRSGFTWRPVTKPLNNAAATRRPSLFDNLSPRQDEEP